jgi:hypothetical protein
MPKSAMMPLQRVQNAAARLILDLRMNDHVAPVLRLLHWLPVDHRVDFKLCTMTGSAGWRTSQVLYQGTSSGGVIC